MAAAEGPTILVVDDAADAREAVARLLALHGYPQVVTAASGEDALALLGVDPAGLGRTVDAVLMDIGMPGLSGIEACDRIKRTARLRDVPVLMLTGKSDEGLLEAAFTAGAGDYITKPIEPAALVARLRSALALKGELDARRRRERELVRLAGELRRTNDELERLSRVDALTGTANRRCLDEVLAGEWARGARERTPVGLVIVDIDHFKALNDARGHPHGDECLQRVAAALRDVLRRPADLVARYGGEEFAVVLGNTSVDGALAVATRIRAAVAKLAIPHPASPVAPHLTVSLGVAALLPRPDQEQERLVALADEALYTAKRSGRDRICVATGQAVPSQRSVSTVTNGNKK